MTASWLEVLATTPQGKVSESAILRWVEGPLRQVFAFERFFAGYGRLIFDRLEVVKVMTSGYDAGFAAQVGSLFEPGERGCFAWWLQNRRPFLLDADSPPAFASAKEIEEVRRYRLGLVGAHGVVDPLAGVGAYFSFAGLPRDDSKGVLAALELIAPPLNALFLRALPLKPPTPAPSALSPRQRDVFALLRQGLSDKGIARKLGVSAETVGAHVRAIYARLGVHSRAELLAGMRGQNDEPA